MFYCSIFTPVHPGAVEDRGAAHHLLLDRLAVLRPGHRSDVGVPRAVYHPVGQDGTTAALALRHHTYGSGNMDGRERSEA